MASRIRTQKRTHWIQYTKMKYPTKKEILNKRPKIDPTIIKIVMIWKEFFFIYWDKKSNQDKLEKLIYLIERINLIQAKSPKKLYILKIELGYFYAYNKKLKTICLDRSNPSIISTLHEIGHHLYGNNELKACRWSVWLFKECFPKEYSKLKWKGHLLSK